MQVVALHDIACEPHVISALGVGEFAVPDPLELEGLTPCARACVISIALTASAARVAKSPNLWPAGALGVDEGSCALDNLWQSSCITSASVGPMPFLQSDPCLVKISHGEHRPHRAGDES